MLLSNCISYIFADDNTILIHDKSIDIIAASLTVNLENIDHWCNENRMAINAYKSKVVYVSTIIVITNSCPYILPHGVSISDSSIETLLCVTIDNTLYLDTCITNDMNAYTIHSCTFYPGSSIIYPPRIVTSFI